MFQELTLQELSKAFANPEDIAHALRIAPHARVIEKPFKLDALVAAVATTLSAQIL